MQERIRYLKQEEKQNTRQMYENIFPEDSKTFVDYYYQWKTRDNDIIVMEDETGYEVMMHLNPYRLKVNGFDVKVPYIVAVATREDSRRKGKMQQVMKQALQDLQKAHCPFTFLLPANPDYYYGQGFVFAPEVAGAKDGAELKAAEVQTVLDISSFLVKPLEWEKLGQTAEIANKILEEQYHVYVRRDAYYYERLVSETASENGAVLVIEEGDRVIGILAYGKGEKAEIKEFLLVQQYEFRRAEICNQIFGENSWNEEAMRMMVRIADLTALNGMLKGEPETWTVQVKDSFVEENNGVWKIEWNLGGGSVTRLAEGKAKECFDISEVTARIVEKWSVFIQEWV